MDQELHSMSTSEAGYNNRLEDTLDIIQLLRNPDAWAGCSSNDLEEVRDFVSGMRDFSRTWQQSEV
jgi:hypothetical protein